MASPLQLPHPSKIVATLRYFDKYDYPLTAEELNFWQPDSDGRETKYFSKDNLFFLPGREKIISLRRQREKISLKKWQIAHEIGGKLKKFSFIQAVFVTGSLAMNNARQSDDIDLMIVTTANTLWITRFLVNIYLSSVRRYPGQKQVANVVCINLWLDENNLIITPQNLYTAHEIVQAKVLWDRNNLSQRFLNSNSWVKDFLPNAFAKPQFPNPKSQKRNNWGLWLVNCGFFILQLLYMKPKMTTERVSLGSAFFHPNSR